MAARLRSGHQPVLLQGWLVVALLAPAEFAAEAQRVTPWPARPWQMIYRQAARQR